VLRAKVSNRTCATWAVYAKCFLRYLFIELRLHSLVAAANLGLQRPSGTSGKGALYAPLAKLRLGLTRMAACDGRHSPRVMQLAKIERSVSSTLRGFHGLD
jgi:hypothetical protein